MKKKGQGLSMNLIVVAAIAMIVLVVVIMIFVGRTGRFAKSTDLCPGTCLEESEVATLCSGEVNGVFKQVSSSYSCSQSDIDQGRTKCCISVG